MTSQTEALPINYVDNEENLRFVVEAIEKAEFVAFDTEFVGEATYLPQLCILQVATAEAIWIIDPLAHLELKSFWVALTAPGHTLVALAARQEVLFCLRYAGRPPAALFDPQLAAGLVGFAYPLSHTNLVQQVLGVGIAGSESFTDWRLRPLSKKQLEYAANDVAHLLAIRTRLAEMADEMGRVEWLHDECIESVQRVIQEEHRERWLRLGGASSLDRRALAVLRELWHWRDDAAKNADLPPRKILGDELLIAIAKRQPRSTAELFALRGLDCPHIRKAGADIVAASVEGLQLPEANLPSSLRRGDETQIQTLVPFVAVVANQQARQHKVDPGLLAANSDLQEVLRWSLANRKGERPSVLEGWRGEILTDSLLALLEGRTAVRISHLKSEFPFSIEAWE